MRESFFIFLIVLELTLSFLLWDDMIGSMAKRVLIIDDDTYIRELYEEVLKNEGFEVVTAADGQEGLDHLLAGGNDAVLLDVMMPKLDGIGVLTKLKNAQPKAPNGPILLLTNLDHDPVLDQAAALGIQKHLLKADMLPPMLIEAVKTAVGLSTEHPQPGQ